MTACTVSKRLLLCIVLALVASACAPVTAPSKRYFWPPPPDQPRIEYINFYQTKDDAKRGVENWLADAIFGKESPQVFFRRPKAIASDGKGRVIVSDLDRRTVDVFDLARHEVRTLSEVIDGRKVDKFFRQPQDVTVDSLGRIYVADAGSRTISRYTADEHADRVFNPEELQRPVGLAVDEPHGLIYVADSGAHQVLVLDSAGTFQYAIGKRGKGEGEFNYPVDIDLDSAGNLYVLDSMNARVQVFDPDGRFLRAFGERGTASGSFQVPKSIAVSPSGHVYVTDSQTNRFVIFDLLGEYLLTVGGRQAVTDDQVAPGGFYLPAGIDVDSTEAIWVVDSLNRMFHQFQYLNDDYLSRHPILPGQAEIPSRPGSAASPDAGEGH